MRILVSAPRPSGHLAVVRLPDGALFTARYVDDPDGQERDITALVADILLSGALDQVEAAAAGRPEPTEVVHAAAVAYREPLLPGQVRAAASFTWLHVPTGDGGDFPAEDVLGLLARGIAVEITSGVAAEAADVPADTASLEGSGSTDEPVEG